MIEDLHSRIADLEQRLAAAEKRAEEAEEKAFKRAEAAALPTLAEAEREVAEANRRAEEANQLVRDLWRAFSGEEDTGGCPTAYIEGATRWRRSLMKRAEEAAAKVEQTSSILEDERGELAASLRRAEEAEHAIDDVVHREEAAESRAALAHKRAAEAAEAAREALEQVRYAIWPGSPTGRDVPPGVREAVSKIIDAALARPSSLAERDAKAQNDTLYEIAKVVYGEGLERDGWDRGELVVAVKAWKPVVRAAVTWEEYDDQEESLRDAVRALPPEMRP